MGERNGPWVHNAQPSSCGSYCCNTRPGVVLVHGSGPNDRDETIGPNKPFRDLAWGLATRGIAVLRYEKRTKRHRLKMALLANSLTVKEETIDDAVAAVTTLHAVEEIDASRIFVLPARRQNTPSRAMWLRR